uniref:Uncharacterized protein n=1 Tax=Trichinella nativa TaxID=6335 RepID=A0A0V1KIV4_9BILA
MREWPETPRTVQEQSIVRWEVLLSRQTHAEASLPLR